jgi:hypothetical protein
VLFCRTDRMNRLREQLAAGRGEHTRDEGDGR